MMTQLKDSVVTIHVFTFNDKLFTNIRNLARQYHVTLDCHQLRITDDSELENAKIIHETLKETVTWINLSPYYQHLLQGNNTNKSRIPSPQNMV